MPWIRQMWIKSCWQISRLINTLALLWGPMIYEQFAVSSVTQQYCDGFLLFLHLTGWKSIILGNSLICLSYNEAYYRAKTQPYFVCQANAQFKTLFSILSLGSDSILDLETWFVQPPPQWIHGIHQDLNMFQLFGAHLHTMTLLIFQSCLGSVPQKSLIVKLHVYSTAGKSHLSVFLRLPLQECLWVPELG